MANRAHMVKRVPLIGGCACFLSRFAILPHSEPRAQGDFCSVCVVHQRHRAVSDSVASHIFAFLAFFNAHTRHVLGFAAN